MSRRVMKCRVMSEKNPSEGVDRVPAQQLQLIVSLATSGNLEGAAAEVRKIVDRSVAAQAWRVLSGTNANMQRWNAALEALEIALQHDPGSRPIRLERAVLLERCGQDRESLAELEQLESEAADSPQLLVQLGRALQ